ncbi:RusA family crossover junction endodeoxyribonuclease [Achromobacter xylosoxidans]|uniref:RusA family crossover junction endodeoxyribonuclease n=1 Tax=Alcaligenes xylosoxydans xylosoxydans TaxID=85698 RepID=UPI0004B162DC|nr:RusA family crossover junction endodeoxyribonuclease [Achromobacter xylosoxidans]
MNASPNLTDPYDPMAGTLARTAMQCRARGCDGCLVCVPDSFARAADAAAYAFDGSDRATTGNTMAEVVASLDPNPWAEDGAQSGPNASPRRANAGSGVAPSVLLTLPYPISANRYWASRTVTPRGKPAFTSTYVTPEAKAYKAQVQKLALVAGVRKPIAGRVRVEFTLYPNRPQDWQKRMRKDGAAWDDTVQCLDLDNAQKVVLDSLKDVVFQDDAWVREISARRAEPDEFGARLVAVVTPLAVEQPQTDLFGAVAQERKA